MVTKEERRIYFREWQRKHRLENPEQYARDKQRSIEANKLKYRLNHGIPTTIAGRFIYELQKQLDQDERRRAKRRLWYKANALKMRVKNKAWREKESEAIKARRLTRHLADPSRRNQRQQAAQDLDRKANPEKYKAYRDKPDSRAKRNAKSLEYNQRNASKIASRKRERMMTDPIYRLSQLIRTRTYRALKGLRKSNSTLKLLGCASWGDFYETIMAKLLPGMDMSNYGSGKGKWNLDHERPVTSFNLIDPLEQAKAFHVSNLKPMWSTDNSQKSSTWNGRFWHYSDHKTIETKGNP